MSSDQVRTVDGRITRRRFLHTCCGIGGAGLGALAVNTDRAVPSDASRVVLVRNPAVSEGGEVVEGVLAEMIDGAVAKLTGETSPEAAWRKLFSSDEVIGLKPNGLGGPMLSTANALIHIGVERLRGIGVKTDNIVVWDQDPGKLAACGLDIGTGAWGVKCIAASAELDEPMEHGSFSGRLTTVLTKQIDAYINLPIIKDHYLAGITGALKSHYGSISNPGDHHANNCDPYIADLYSIPVVREKSRLIITDGTRATCEGGPGYNPLWVWNANLIMAATDPVANDVQIYKIISEQRQTKGLPPLEGIGRAPKSIFTAAERGLGTADEARIALSEIDLG